MVWVGCAVFEITVGQWSISRRDHVTNHYAMWSDKMANRKWASWSVSKTSSSDSAGQPLKGGCYWPKASTSGSQNMIELNSSAWLKYTIINRFYVDTLTCSICARFRSLKAIILPTPKALETYEWAVSRIMQSEPCTFGLCHCIWPNIKTSEQKPTWASFNT